MLVDVDERKAQCAAGMAPATPWVYSVLELAELAYCQGRATPTMVVDWGDQEDTPMRERVCPVCQTVHPHE